MTFLEWKRAEEKEQEKSSSKKTSTTNRTSVTSGDDSEESLLDYVRRNRAIRSSDSAQNWFDCGKSLLNEVKLYYSEPKWGGGDPDYYDDLQSRASHLLANADNWRKQYAGDKKVISNIDSMVSALSKMKQSAMRTRDSYAQFKDEEDYNTRFGYADKHKGKTFEEIQKEYEAASKDKNRASEAEWLKAYSENYGYKDDAYYAAYTKSVDDRLAEIDSEITAAKAAGTEYDGTYDYGFVPNAATHNKYVKQEEIDALEAERTVLAAEKKRVQYNREGFELGSVSDSDPDFKKYADIGAKVDNPDSIDDKMGWFAVGGWQPFGEEVNNPVTFALNNKDEYEKKSLEAVAGGGQPNPKVYGINHLVYEMNEDEIAVYNYYIGKGDKESADKYLESITGTLNNRIAQKNFKAMEGNTAGEVLFGALVGLDQFSTGVNNFFSNEDDYIPASAIAQTGQMVREDLDDDGFDILGNSLGQLAYDMVTTTANMAPSIAMGAIPVVGQGLGLASMGVSAAGNAYSEAINNGYSKGQARAYSTLVGASEAGLSYVLGGISKLGGKVSGNIISKLTSGVNNAFARAAITIGGNMVSEFTEEGLQEVLDPFFKNIAMNANNDWSDVEWGQVAYSGLLGALSAGILEGRGTIAGEVNTYKQGKAVMEKGETSNLVKFGKSLSADTVAYKLADKIDKGEVKTGAYTIGRLLHEAGADSLSETNIAEIEKSLVRKGVAPSHATTIATWLNKAVEGGHFTKSQRNALESNEVVSQTFKDIILNQNSTVNQRMFGAVENGYLTREQLEKLADNGTNAGALASAVLKSDATAEASVEETDSKKAPEAVDTTGFALLSDSEVKNRIADDPLFAVAYEQFVGGVNSEVQGAKAINPVAKSASFPNKRTMTSADDLSLSEDGVTRVASTGAEVAIKGVKIAKAHGEKTTYQFKVVDSEGNARYVDHSDIEYKSESEALLYESFVDLGIDPAYFDSYVANFNKADFDVKQGDIPAEWQYAAGFNEAVNFGKSGLSGGYKVLAGDGKAAVSSSYLENGVFTKNLKENVRNLAYNLGKTATESEVDAKAKAIEKAVQKRKDSGKGKVKEKGSLFFEERADEVLNDYQKVGLEYAERLTEYGNDVYIFRSTVDANGNRVDDRGKLCPNGFYRGKDGSIHIDLYAGGDGKGLMLYTMAHELLHHGKKYARREFEIFKKLLYEWYGEKYDPAHDKSIDALIKQRMEDEGKSWDEAEEEVLADFCEPFLTDGNIDERVAQLKATDEKTFHFVRDIIRKLYEWAKSVYSKINPDSEEGQFARKHKDSLERVYDAFAKMIYTASENLQWTGGDISQNNSLDNDIKNAQRTTPFSKGNLERYTPKRYNDYGWVAVNKVLTGKELKKLYSQFARIKLNKNKNFKNKLGEYLIPVGDKYGDFDHLVYIKGTNKHPIIRQVVEIKEQYRENTEKIITEVISDEETGLYYDAFEFYGDYARTEIFNVHKAIDYPSYSELKNEGRRGQDDTRTYVNDRERNDGTRVSETRRGEVRSEDVGLEYSKRDRTLVSKDVEGLSDDSEKKNPYLERGGEFYKDKTIYAYDFLVNQEPMVVLEVPNLSDIYTDGKIDKSKIVSAGKKNALAQDGSKSGTDGAVYVQNRYTGSSIEINNQSIKHGLGGKKNFVITNARLGMIIGDVIRNGIPINEITPSDGAVGTYALVAYAVSSAKKEFLVIAHVDVRKNKVVGLESVDSVHSIRGRIKRGSTTAVNSAQGLSEDNGTFSTSVISISDLLEFVNSTSQSLLSDDVLTHLKQQRDEGGFYYGKVLHQTRKSGTSARSLLANALESVAQNDIERNKLLKFKEKMELLNEEEKKLRELNEQIHQLAFPKKGSKKDQQKINELRLEANKTLNRINILDKSLFSLEASAPLKAVLQREKDAARKKYEKEGRERTKQKVKEKTESISKKHAKKELERLVLETTAWLTKPKKGEVPCPDIIKEPLADFLAGIDTSSKKLLTKGVATQSDLKFAIAMNSLATAVEKIKNSQDPSKENSKGTIIDGYLDLPPDFVENIRAQAEAIKNYIKLASEGDSIINDMSADELKELSRIIKMLKKSIKEMQRLYTNYRFANAVALGKATVGYLNSLGAAKEESKFKDFAVWDNTVPYYAFKRFGEGGESIFESLMDAQDKLAFHADEILAFKEKNWTDKEVSSWSKEVQSISLENGEELKFTAADAMSIYCLSKRYQAVGHLLGGGVRVIGATKGGKKAADSVANLSPLDVEAICNTLTDRQKEVADKMQEFMTTVCADWGNEIWMKRFLTKNFTEKNYFPIESDPNTGDKKDPAAKQSDLFRLLNISATKPLADDANNKIVIRNVFDVFTAHTSDMARLNAYGMALLDYMKWLNYRERHVDSENGQVKLNGVRPSLEEAYGSAAEKYIVQLIKDINGSSDAAKDNAFSMKMIRSSKVAAVGANLRVAALQITALPRAGIVLDTKSIILGMRKRPNIKKAKKYCGIALWKSFGFYDTNIGKSIESQIKGDTKISEKMVELSMKGAELGDSLVFGYLWNACEYEIAKTKQYKVGSEEFNQAVAKKLREVVYASQVVDSVLTKSQLMRSRSGLNQMVSAFMSEPTLTYNVLLDCKSQFDNEAKRTGSKTAAWKATKGIIVRGIASYVVTNILTALAEGFADAFRDDDDDPFGEKFIEAFWENFLKDINPLNKIPIFNDIVSFVESRLGYGYFSSGDSTTGYLDTVGKAYDAWVDIIKNGEDAERPLYYAIYNTAKAFSQFSGLPISNVMREVVTLWNNTAGTYDYNLKIRTYEPSDSTNAENLYQAIVSGDTKQQGKLESLWEDEIERQKDLKTVIGSHFKEGDIDSAVANQYLKVYCGIEDEDIHWQMDRWQYAAETGSSEGYAKYDDFFTAVESGENLRAVIQEYTKNGVEKSTLASQITGHFKPLYKEMSNYERASLKGYLLNAYSVLGYERSKKSKDIDKWLKE